MANPDLYKADVKLTPKGAKIDLGTLYLYPDGHGNLTFADGRNWPFAEQLQTIEGLLDLVRMVQDAARRRQV
jgi:hypothetical protein